MMNGPMKVEWVNGAEHWIRELDDGATDRVMKIVTQLQMKGRGFLGMPYGKRIQDTDELYEVRIAYKGSLFRILYAYESNGSEWAVLLVAGDKKGDDRFYDHMIPAAEKVLEAYRSSE